MQKNEIEKILYGGGEVPDVYSYDIDAMLSDYPGLDELMAGIQIKATGGNSSIALYEALLTGIVAGAAGLVLESFRFEPGDIKSDAWTHRQVSGRSGQYSTWSKCLELSDVVDKAAAIIWFMGEAAENGGTTDPGYSSFACADVLDKMERIRSIIDEIQRMSIREGVNCGNAS